MQNSFCRFGKISSGFCNQTFLQYGCKRAFTSFRDVCWAPPADLGKSHWGLAIMHPYQFGVKWGSMAGLHQLSWVNLGRVPEIMYNGGRECWPVLVGSKQETNGQKIPVIGSKVKVSIIPHAAAIQCWCSSPVESSLVVWSTIGGHAYGLVTKRGGLPLVVWSMVWWPCLWVGDQEGDPQPLTHRICTT